MAGLAAQLTIPIKDEGTTGPFVFNEAQWRLARQLEASPWIVLLKIRQLGSTTLLSLWLLALALSNPGLNFALVLQNTSFARQKLSELKLWLGQLGILEDCPVNGADKVTLPNGASIHAVAARAANEADGKESSAGRSVAFAAAVFSEAGYYANRKTYNAIKAAVGTGPIVVESTASGPDGVFADLWSQKNDYTKIFLGIQDAEQKVLPEDAIDEADWQDLQEEYGFTSRPHAAWWLRELRDSGGDVIAHLRDYPVKPEHPFVVADGRWIEIDPEVREPLRTDDKQCAIYAEPTLATRYVLAVDVSYGVGSDASVAVVIDRSTWNIAALYYSNVVKTDVLADRIVHLADMYECRQHILVEANGIGGYAVEELWKLGIAPMPVHTNEASKFGGLLMAKRVIESKRCFGPKELLAEAKSLRVTDRGQGDRKTNGKKDLIMALGIAYLWIEKNPWVPPEKRPDPTRVFIRSRRRKVRATV